MSESTTLSPDDEQLAGDPDDWTARRLQDCRRRVLHYEARGDKDAAARWKRAEKCLDYALAMFMSAAQIPDRPEDKTLVLTRAVLLDVANSGTDMARIRAVRLLLKLEGKNL